MTFKECEFLKLKCQYLRVRLNWTVLPCNKFPRVKIWIKTLLEDFKKWTPKSFMQIYRKVYINHSTIKPFCSIFLAFPTFSSSLKQNGNNFFLVSGEKQRKFEIFYVFLTSFFVEFAFASTLRLQSGSNEYSEYSEYSGGPLGKISFLNDILCAFELFFKSFFQRVLLNSFEQCSYV